MSRYRRPSLIDSRAKEPGEVAEGRWVIMVEPDNAAEYVDQDHQHAWEHLKLTRETELRDQASVLRLGPHAKETTSWARWTEPKLFPPRITASASALRNSVSAFSSGGAAASALDERAESSARLGKMALAQRQQMAQSSASAEGEGGGGGDSLVLVSHSTSLSLLAFPPYVALLRCIFPWVRHDLFEDTPHMPRHLQIQLGFRFALPPHLAQFAAALLFLGFEAATQQAQALHMLNHPPDPEMAKRRSYVDPWSAVNLPAPQPEALLHAFVPGWNDKALAAQLPPAMRAQHEENAAMMSALIDLWLSMRARSASPSRFPHGCPIAWIGLRRVEGTTRATVDPRCSASFDLRRRVIFFIRLLVTDLLQPKAAGQVHSTLMHFFGDPVQACCDAIMRFTARSHTAAAQAAAVNSNSTLTPERRQQLLAQTPLFAPSLTFLSNSALGRARQALAAGLGAVDPETGMPLYVPLHSAALEHAVRIVNRSVCGKLITPQLLRSPFELAELLCNFAGSELSNTGIMAAAATTAAAGLNAARVYLPQQTARTVEKFLVRRFSGSLSVLVSERKVAAVCVQRDAADPFNPLLCFIHQDGSVSEIVTLHQCVEEALVVGSSSLGRGAAAARRGDDALFGGDSDEDSGGSVSVSRLSLADRLRRMIMATARGTKIRQAVEARAQAALLAASAPSAPALSLFERDEQEEQQPSAAEKSAAAAAASAAAAGVGYDELDAFLSLPAAAACVDDSEILDFILDAAKRSSYSERRKRKAESGAAPAPAGLTYQLDDLAVSQVERRLYADAVVSALETVVEHHPALPFLRGCGIESVELSPHSTLGSVQVRVNRVCGVAVDVSIYDGYFHDTVTGRPALRAPVDETPPSLGEDLPPMSSLAMMKLLHPEEFADDDNDDDDRKEQQSDDDSDNDNRARSYSRADTNSRSPSYSRPASREPSVTQPSAGADAQERQQQQGANRDGSLSTSRAPSFSLGRSQENSMDRDFDDHDAADGVSEAGLGREFPPPSAHNGNSDHAAGLKRWDMPPGRNLFVTRTPMSTFVQQASAPRPWPPGVRSESDAQCYRLAEELVLRCPADNPTKLMTVDNQAFMFHLVRCHADFYSERVAGCGVSKVLVSRDGGFHVERCCGSRVTIDLLRACFEAHVIPALGRRPPYVARRLRHPRMLTAAGGALLAKHRLPDVGTGLLASRRDRRRRRERETKPADGGSTTGAAPPSMFDFSGSVFSII